MADFARSITASAAVTTILKTLGLPAPANIAASADAIPAQMWALATEVGQKLCNAFKWQCLVAEMSITTVPGTSTYALPDDFDGFVVDSAWNHSTRLPAIGSLDQYEWQMLKARQLTGTTFTMLFRIADGFVEFYDTPSVAQTIVLPYQSRGWAVSATGTRQDNLMQNSDIILLDGQLFKDSLKLAWMEAKGFDTTALAGSVAFTLAAAKAKDAPARTLTIGGRSDFPYLGVINMPDTAYGS